MIPKLNLINSMFSLLEEIKLPKGIVSQLQLQQDHLREVVKKSKWKFKMAFAMKGGGSRVPLTYFEFFCLKII